MSAKDKYEAEKRKRLFLPSWKEQYSWVEHGGGNMFCSICRRFPAKADRAGAFFKGTDNYRKQALDAHDRSRNHLQCMLAKQVADNPSAGPLNVWARWASTQRHHQMEKLINTAYHTIKSELPFVAFEKTVALLKKTGVDVGSQYISDVACRRFGNVIYDELWEACAAEIKAAHFISVLTDTATDVSGKDLEGVYIRILSKEGRPKNVFITVEELQHATAPGHYAAINTALQKAELSQWKEKIVGFGSDGAAVMVGRLGGVTTLLRAEIPHLINIQCLGHVLELAVMDAMKGNDRLKKVMDVLKALYKQYHYSPKARRELRELADVLHQKIWKPTNVGGTRWLPHLQRALGTLLKNYPVLLAQLENTIETRVKRELLSSVVASLQHRFQGVESHQVLLAASRLVDPWEWPADQQELASYGSDHVNSVVEHFADVLDRMGCDREKAKRIEWPSAEVIVKSLPQGLQQNAWQDFFVDDDRRKKLF